VGASSERALSRLVAIPQKIEMKKILDILNTIFHMFFRYYDFPCDCGIIKIGNPDENSPVFLSGNYSYTVKMLRKYLKGTDCYLLVADASGSNVWCAAGMNEFSEHDIVDVINVSDLANLVKHRRIIAPPYAASGVDVRYITQETGFRIRWGPTHFKDIPAYIKNNYKRTNDMLAVKFPLRDRIDLALSTAMAYSLTFIFLLIFFPKYIGGFTLLFFAVHLFCFIFFYYLPTERYWRKTLITIIILSLLLAGIAVLASWSTKAFILWESALLGMTIFVAADMCGSTCIYKTTVFYWLKHGNYESLFQPVIDPELCTNCGACVLICPKNVYARLRKTKKVVAVHPKDCMECLACVKQCYYDAVFNKGNKKLKGDVKSIPNLDELTARDTSHLISENRWIDVETEVKGEVPAVAEEAEAALMAPVKPESKVDSTTPPD